MKKSGSCIIEVIICMMIVVISVDAYIKTYSFLVNKKDYINDKFKDYCCVKSINNYANYMNNDELEHINNQEIQVKDILGEEFKHYFAVIKLEFEENIYSVRIKVLKDYKTISELKFIIGETI